MATPETAVNQRQVLFRFSTLRAPELADVETQGYNFITHPADTGVFAQAVKSRPPGETVSEAMQKAADTFAVMPVKDFETKYKDYLPVVQWIGRNKYSGTSDDLLKKLSALTKVDGTTAVWDNLFYQVLRQTDYYMKDNIIGLLRLALIIDLKSTMTTDDFKKVVPNLLQADLVLPIELFPDEPKKEPVSDKPVFSSKAIRKGLDLAAATSAIDSYKKADEEVRALKNKYDLAYSKGYQAAVSKYDEDLQAAYSTATPIEKTQTDCATGCPITYYDWENLTLPTFSFTPPDNVSPQFLKANLSSGSYYVLETLGLINSDTYDDILMGLGFAIEKQYTMYYANQPEGRMVVGVGGMMFEASSSSAASFPSNTQIPYGIFMDYTNSSPIATTLVVTMTLPNADVVSAAYTATLQDGTEITSEDFTDTQGGGLLTITFFPETHLVIPTGNTTIHLVALFQLSDGSLIRLETDVLVKYRFYQYSVADIISQPVKDGGHPFIPSQFGLRRLGIAEYKKVVAEVCCYREAEVSNIINVMQGEFISRTTTRERIQETTTTTESSTEKENLTDTTTSNRFEMQTEIAKMLEEDRQVEAYANFKAHGEHWSLDTGGSYATNNSKEESNHQAVVQATELTQRAMERVVTKFRREVVTKITESFKEENSHIYDNRGTAEHASTGHVSGVYRYINAIYKNQIYNYGKRLMYEFMIPEPSRLYRLGMEIKSKNTNQVNNSVQLVMPIDLKDLGILSASDIVEQNYLTIASKYGAEVEAPIAATLISGDSYQGKGNQGSYSNSYDFKMVEGYELAKIYFRIAVRKANPNLNFHVELGSYQIFQVVNANGNNVQSGMAFAYGHEVLVLPGISGNGNGIPSQSPYNYNLPVFNKDKVPVTITAWDLGAYSMTVTGFFSRTQQAYQQWQIKTYDAIMKAYQDRLDEFNRQVSSAQEDATTMLEANPLFHREIERIALKRNCISYLQPTNYFQGRNYYSGDDFQTSYVTQNQEMDEFASHAKFLEQAFEWDIMSYNFYPYYWGSDSKWKDLYQTENDDPTFRNFMQAGMARVIVSVRPGFENAMMHFMKFGIIWDGGEMPVIGDPLYLAITEELKTPEYVVDETWETVVPTSLIGIQRSGVLVDQDGLPCGGGCEGEGNSLKGNDNKFPDYHADPTPPAA